MSYVQRHKWMIGITSICYWKFLTNQVLTRVVDFLLCLCCVPPSLEYLWCEFLQRMFNSGTTLQLIDTCVVHRHRLVDSIKLVSDLEITLVNTPFFNSTNPRSTRPAVSILSLNAPMLPYSDVAKGALVVEPDPDYFYQHHISSIVSTRQMLKCKHI